MKYVQLIMRIILSLSLLLSIVLMQGAAIADWYEDFKQKLVSHNFNLAPGGNVVPQVTGYYYEHAYVRDPGFRENKNPPGGGWGMFNVPAAGFNNLNNPFQAKVWAPINSAEANSRFNIAPFGAGGVVTGSMQVDVWADAWISAAPDPPPVFPKPSMAYAYAKAKVSARGGRALRNGAIQWFPKISTPPVAISITNYNLRKLWDPISFDVQDLQTGQVLSGTLLDIQGSLTGIGSMLWDAATGEFTVKTTDSFVFTIDIPGIYTAESGKLNLQINQGIVTTSEDSGIFDGILPAVGSPGNFTTTLGGITLNYNLGDFGGHELDVNLGFEGAGEATAQLVPLPHSLSLLIMGFLRLAAWRHRNSGIV
jgi:hypothetical protein